MTDYYAKAGDILIYSDAKDDIDKLIQYGEERLRRFKQQGQPIAYHVAVAIDPYNKIEADAKGVEMRKIDYANCSLFRPPAVRHKQQKALVWLRQQRGKLYGWIGDIDQGLRDLTFNKVHLPRRFVAWANKRWPYCSALTADFMVKSGYNDCVSKEYTIPAWPPLDPEAILLLVKSYPVKP